MLNPLTKVTVLDFSYRAWGKALTRRDTYARYLNHIITDMKKQKQYYLKHKELSYGTCTTSRNVDKFCKEQVSSHMFLDTY
jgi:hypothetical protein